MRASENPPGADTKKRNGQDCKDPAQGCERAAAPLEKNGRNRRKRKQVGQKSNERGRPGLETQAEHEVHQRIHLCSIGKQRR
jgi:hypothetical protein